MIEKIIEVHSGTSKDVFNKQKVLLKVTTGFFYAYCCETKERNTSD